MIMIMLKFFILINGMMTFMSEIFIAFLIVTVSFVGLSLGLILRSQPIKGSCGGMANLEEGAECQFCGRTDPKSCNN